MRTLTIQSTVPDDGRLEIVVPNLPPGPVKVVLEMGGTAPHASPFPKWEHLYGLGKEVWQGVDALKYIDDLRADREVAR